MAPPAGQHSTRRFGDRRGFALSETIVTLMLMGLLSAVAIPSIRTSARQHRMTEHGQRLHAMITDARSLALSQQRRHRMRLDSGRTPYLEVWDGAAWSVVRGGKTLTESTYLLVVGGGTVTTSGTVTFNARGQAEDSRAFVFGNEDRLRSIVIGRSGLIRWSGSSL